MNEFSLYVLSFLQERLGFCLIDEEDKSALYQVPYQNMVQFMFEMQNEQQFNTLYDRIQGTRNVILFVNFFSKRIDI